MNTHVAITHRTTETLQAAIAGHVSVPSVSPPVTIAFDADELCGYYEFHKFMDVELRCGFSKGHTSKHYDYRHRMKF